LLVSVEFGVSGRRRLRLAPVRIVLQVKKNDRLIKHRVIAPASHREPSQRLQSAPSAVTMT